MHQNDDDDDELREKVAFGPNDAVDRTGGCAPNGADGKPFGCWFPATVVTLGRVLDDGLHLSGISGSAAFNQRCAGGHAHFVHMSPGIWRTEVEVSSPWHLGVG